MDAKLAKIMEYIDSQLPIWEEETAEIEERMEEEFNPMDWSGGNFDDAYNLGEEAGEAFAKYEVMTRIKRIIEEA
jgi:hypothetical protein